MSGNMKKGDEVGLFYSYSDEEAMFYGHATCWGEQELPQEEVDQLATPGKFNSKRSRPLGVTYQLSRQLRFILNETGETIWENECFYAPADRTKLLLAETKKVVGIPISLVRKVTNQPVSDGPRYRGHITIHCSFTDVSIDEEEMVNKIEGHLGSLGIKDPDIKVREYCEDEPEVIWRLRHGIALLEAGDQRE